MSSGTFFFLRKPSVIAVGIGVAGGIEVEILATLFATVYPI